MVDWLVLTAVKLLKTVLLAGLAILTPPPDGVEVRSIPGLEPRCRGTIILIRHEVNAPSEVHEVVEVHALALRPLPAVDLLRLRSL
jgi:hypothetical protein